MFFLIEHLFIYFISVWHQTKMLSTQKYILEFKLHYHQTTMFLFMFIISSEFQSESMFSCEHAQFHTRKLFDIHSARFLFVKHIAHHTSSTGTITSSKMRRKYIPILPWKDISSQNSLTIPLLCENIIFMAVIHWFHSPSQSISISFPINMTLF